MAEDEVTEDAEEPILVQHAAGLTWDLCRPPVSMDVIEEHESFLGVEFPDDFRSVIQLCPGGHPVERNVFWMEHPAHGRLGSGLGALMTLGPLSDVDGMRWSTSVLRKHHGFSDEIIPIALDGGGDYVCLDYRTSANHPKVVYYSNEAPTGESFGYLAPSFSEFLAMLEAPEEDPDDID